MSFDLSERLVRRRAKYQRVRERVRQQQAEYYRRNADTIKARVARNRAERPEDPAARSERNKSWYLRKKAADPTYFAEKRAGRRALESQPVDREYVWARDFGLCHICNEGVDRADAEFDHVVPLSRGGNHHENNLRVSHRRCNRSKGTRLLSEMAS